MSQQESGRRAIALEYDGSNAPRVTASGTEALAEQIIAVAREHGVPLFENAELAQLLSQLELGDEIPELLYRCIAQVIAFAYFVRGRVPEGWQDPADTPPAWAGASKQEAEQWPLLPDAE